MKIAFVGKGGSGKSTITALFTSYLSQKNNNLLLIDADLNIHMPQLLNIEFDKTKALSLNENTQNIKEYLRGDNKRIANTNEIYKTTPPAKGSQLLSLNPSNPLIKEYAFEFGENSYFMFVGTYENGEIGRSCYHTNLSIFENILSHSKLEENDWIIADMVAGIDAFSNTLHAQFDAIVLVVEPSLESIEVFNQYKEMLEVSGNYDDLLIIANKIEDVDDLDFIKERIDSDKLIGSINKKSQIKKARQRDEKLSIDLLDKTDLEILEKVQNKTKELQKTPTEMLKRLHKLHLKYIDQDYVKRAVGDISNQIDTEYNYE